MDTQTFTKTKTLTKTRVAVWTAGTIVAFAAAAVASNQISTSVTAKLNLSLSPQTPQADLVLKSSSERQALLAFEASTENQPLILYSLKITGQTKDDPKLFSRLQNFNLYQVSSFNRTDDFYNADQILSQTAALTIESNGSKSAYVVFDNLNLRLEAGSKATFVLKADIISGDSIGLIQFQIKDSQSVLAQETSPATSNQPVQAAIVSSNVQGGWLKIEQ